MKKIILFASVFAVVMGFAPGWAVAGQLFPPRNQDDIVTGGCDANSVLVWDRGPMEVQCVPASSRVSVLSSAISLVRACAPGQAMSGIQSGQAVCTPDFGYNYSCPAGQAITSVVEGVAVCAPMASIAGGTCPSGQAMSGISASGTPVCSQVAAGGVRDTTCPPGQAITGIVAGVPICSTVPGGSGGGSVSVSPCPSGQVMTGISNGVAQCAQVSLGNFSCPSGKVLAGMDNGSPVCVNGTGEPGTIAIVTFKNRGEYQSTLRTALAKVVSPSGLGQALSMCNTFSFFPIFDFMAFMTDGLCGTAVCYNAYNAAPIATQSLNPYTLSICKAKNGSRCPADATMGWICIY